MVLTKIPKKTIVIMIVALLISATIILLKTHQKKAQIIEMHPTYIWDEINNEVFENDYWLRFRKTFKIDENVNLENIIANITADTRYWLYINDEMIVREGSLKRGQNKNSVYYDEVDLSEVLKNGENTIAILVWHSGIENFSSTPYSQKGLYFEIPSLNLITDKTWKVSKYAAYLHTQNISGEEIPNDRLGEANIWFDARMAEDDWYKSNYNDSSWANANILPNNNYELIKRDIPLFKEYELKEYSNMKLYENYKTTENETLEMTIPYNAQINPYLKIETTAGKRIDIYTDTYDTNGVKSLKATYITKDGVQEFEALQWINGEKVYYEIPADVTILSLAYREIGYNSEKLGKFECDDKFLSSLWEKASRTLYVNMHDNYMDCPNRERAQWSLDMAVEMEEALYALDTNSYDLYKHGIRTIIGWREDKAFLTVVPNSLSPQQLPVQNLLLIATLLEYYEYTGDTAFLEEVYPAVNEYLDLWIKNEYGSLQLLSYYHIWEWNDSSEELDYKQLECISYYLANKTAYKMAEILLNEPDVEKYKNRLDDVGKMYNSYLTEECKDGRLNALAVIAGLASKDQYSKITKILTENYDASPVMEKYVLEALCIMGKEEEAQKRIKSKYYEMVDGENACSTLWEHWEYGIGSTNHAWAGGPLTIMSKYFAGISPLEPGYETVLVKPQIGNLSKIDCNVCTVKGIINFYIDKKEKSTSMKLNTPVKALIAIPKYENIENISINEKLVYKNSKPKNTFSYKFEKEDEDYLYYRIPKGNYIIDCKIK